MPAGRDVERGQAAGGSSRCRRSPPRRRRARRRARNSTIEWPPVSSSPSQAKRTLTGSSPARASSRAAGEQQVQLALVVGDPAAVQVLAADLGLERRRLPQLERIGRLHVEVAVAEDRRRVGRSRATPAARRPRAVARASRPARTPRRRRGSSRTPSSPACATSAARRRVGADRRDPQELGQLVEPVRHQLA